MLGGLAKRRDRLDGYLIETSGLADPAPIAQTFLADDAIRQQARLDSILCVADARHLPTSLAESREAAEQLALADTVLLNKVDLVDAGGLVRAAQAISRANPSARVLHAVRGNVPLDQLLDRGAFDLARLDVEAGPEEHAHGHSHHGPARHTDGITCVSLQIDQALDRGRFMAWLQRLMLEQGQDLLRAKGIVNLAGAARRFVFQGVHMMMDTELTQPWTDGERRDSRLVFIGRRLDAALLQDELQHCAAAP